MSTVSLMTSLLTEDCSRFLPPQHRTLDHRLFEDMSVAKQDPLMTQNANVVDLEDRRHSVDCQSDMLVRDPSATETPVLPAWTIFALVHKASTAGEVETRSGHTDSHLNTIVVLLHSSLTVTFYQPSNLTLIYAMTAHGLTDKSKLPHVAGEFRLSRKHFSLPAQKNYNPTTNDNKRYDRVIG